MFAKSVTTKPRRFLMALGTLGLAAAVWAPAPVRAQQSPPSPADATILIPGDPPFDFRICPSFDVRIDIQGKQGILALPGGTTIVTSPALKATVTNLATGEQVDLNITGTTQISASGDQVFLGSNLVLRALRFGDTTNMLAYVKGRFTFPPFSGVGTLTDICALLA
jgi:hypothetical protein